MSARLRKGSRPQHQMYPAVGDVKVQLTDGTNFAEWEPATTDLQAGGATVKDYGTHSLGALTVTLIVTDVTGNGLVSGSDYLKVTASGGFFFGTTYSAILIYELTGERIGSGVVFMGDTYPG